ncbi:protein arginine N-methyltransferase 8-like [Teleopsis dalmanni]|uniref:protein arginine N-methyltransferase 8-like n=1 Tax=Teleopsis dalmanni TaxID=139649 RepID=UPI0018CF4B38|nr:protein arginine N-methyltransferase 8-like [Teleopsis dalmanni]
MSDNPMQTANGSATAADCDNEAKKKSRIRLEDMTSQDFYTDMFAYYGTHEEKLKDRAQIVAFRTAMYNNKQLFKNKVVLDVGCGTGILSMFAIKAGAARVIAIDNSNILELTKKVFEDNEMSLHIDLIQGEIEEIELGVEKVDIIISEWFSYNLFHLSILDKVLYARDKWLKPHGLIFPDIGRLYITAIEAFNSKAFKINWWNKVYDFDMSCVRKAVIKEPSISIVYANHLVTNSCLIKEVDLYKIQKTDLEFASKFQLKVQRNDYVHAFVTYFDIEFSKCFSPIKFSTSPWTDDTHWKQCVFYLDDFITVKEDEEITGIFEMKYLQTKKTALYFGIKVDFEGEISQIHEINSYNMD